MASTPPQRRLRHTFNLFVRYQNWRELSDQLNRGTPPTRAVLRNGLQVSAPENHKLLATLSEIFFQQRYTPPGCRIEPGDVVVDIGANVGIFALFAATQGARTVRAYEPEPGNFQYLERNCAANLDTAALGKRAGSVVPHQAAVADQEGTVRLYLGKTSGGNKLYDVSQGSSQAYVDVPSVSLEQVLEGMEQVEFLKVDCEGAEGLIFTTATPACLRKVRKLSMEFHDEYSTLSHGEIGRILEAAGFTTWLRWDGRSTLGYLYARRDAK